VHVLDPSPPLGIIETQHSGCNRNGGSTEWQLSTVHGISVLKLDELSNLGDHALPEPATRLYGQAMDCTPAAWVPYLAHLFILAF